MLWDDIQKLSPKDLVFQGGRITAVLRATKTAGPSKRVQELPLCASEFAYISNAFWLRSGFDLIREYAASERDYLLAKLTEDAVAFRRCMASYSDIVAYSAQLRKGLRRPGGEEPLMHQQPSTFWTEHSERATLPTGLALLGTQKEEGDMLGRWKPSGADTYMRMCYRQAAAAICRGS